LEEAHMKMLLSIITVATVFFVACGKSASPTAPTPVGGERYSGSYSYTNQQAGPNISGTLAFTLGQSDFSEIKNIQIVVNGCPNANVQVDSVLVPAQAGPPGRGKDWFTITLTPTKTENIWLNCGWHDNGTTTCGMFIGINSCGTFGGSDKDYGFPISK
jgi:hypothetical protein